MWGGLPVSEVVSQPRSRDTGKAGTRQAAGFGRRRNLWGNFAFSYKAIISSRPRAREQKRFI